MMKCAVFVKIDGVLHSTNISEETHRLIRDGLILKNKMMRWFLAEVVKSCGSLTEENILKYMGEKWVL